MWNDPEAGDNRLMHATRVTKTLWPPAAGTAQISGRYAQDLVCVRYRQDANGLWRFTTAEIIIAEGPVNSKGSMSFRVERNNLILAPPARTDEPADD